MIEIAIPWPPSANKYWRYVNGRVLISKEARAYKANMQKLGLIWKHPCLEGRLCLRIAVYPPNKRKRDIDNLLKVTLDSLMEAGLYKDDSQIDTILIERKPLVVEGGEIVVFIKELFYGHE